MKVYGELERAQLEQLSSDPTGFKARIYYNTTTGDVRYHDGSNWRSMIEIPVGTIIPFYDFNGTVTFDTNHWMYCDGSTVSDSASPIDGQSLPDLSGRYLVGFGSDGGGDIDTATWATAPVGNANHINNHYHGLGTLSMASDGSHYHLRGQGYNCYCASSGIWESHTRSAFNDTATTTAGAHTHTLSGNVGNTSGSSGDSNFSIQPRSIRVRFIIRYK